MTGMAVHDHHATPLPLSPFITAPDNRFILDVAAFMAEVEPAPSFLSNPRPEYLRASELIPIVEILARPH